MKKDASSKLPNNDIFIRGTIIAVIITIPSISVFFIAWYILDDLISAAIIGTIIHFIGIATSFKFSKKIFKKP